MAIPNCIDVEMIREANVRTMKKNFLRSPKLRHVFNEKSRPENNQGVGQRLQIITRTQKAEDPSALITFSQKQQLLFRECQNLVQIKAKELLDTTQPIELVESLLLSKDNSEVRQELHPDLPNTYVSKAVLAFISFEDNTTLIICPRSHNQVDIANHNRVTTRYGLAAGTALFFHPLLVHAGDSYVEFNIRIHYYAFVQGTRWELDSRYELKSSVAERLTHSVSLVSSNIKKKVKTREAAER